MSKPNPLRHKPVKFRPAVKPYTEEELYILRQRACYQGIFNCLTVLAGPESILTSAEHQNSTYKPPLIGMAEDEKLAVLRLIKVNLTLLLKAFNS